MNKAWIIIATSSTLAILGNANAATLTLGTRSVQQLVAEKVFTDHGRWNLLDGTCYAYLDTPRTWLAQGRIVVEAHLSAHLGAPMSGNCVGSELASKVVVSGRLVGAGTKLTLTEIRFDRVDDETTRSAIDLLQSLAPTTLPPFDVLDAIRARTADPGEIPMVVDKLQIDGVTTTDTAISVRFDVALHAP